MAANAIYLLFQHYGENQTFMQDFGGLIDSHGAELSKYPPPSEMDEPSPLISGAKGLAIKWGLNAPWAPSSIIWEAKINYVRKQPDPNLGSGRIDSYRFPLNATFTISKIPPPGEMKITLEMEYHPSEETRISFLERATGELRKQAEIIEQRFEAKGMVPQEHKMALETHILWLYERVALKLTPIQIWDKHRYDRKPPLQNGIEDGIRKAAKLLEITLPRNRAPFTR